MTIVLSMIEKWLTLDGTPKVFKDYQKDFRSPETMATSKCQMPSVIVKRKTKENHPDQSELETKAIKQHL